MIFNFVWTPWASRQLGARAEGARAGDPIGHGMTPQARAMSRGLTAALNSCARLDLRCVSGGATTMWDMDDQWITLDRMKAVLRRFLDGGGMIFQGNTTSVHDLQAALDHPECYPELIVRVGGFSARFTTLDPDVQQEIVARHRHSG
jgi:formate C-acetyltransferase